MIEFLRVIGARAHNSWVNRDGLKNSAGEWHCGDYDCKAYETAQSMAQDWMLDGELVTYDEAMPIAPRTGRLRCVDVRMRREDVCSGSSQASELKSAA